jgi:hypothetical protein
VIPGREGEAWFLDEFGGFGKVGLFAAPTAALAAALDTNPRHRTRTPLPRGPTCGTRITRGCAGRH